MAKVRTRQHIWVIALGVGSLVWGVFALMASTRLYHMLQGQWHGMHALP